MAEILREIHSESTYGRSRVHQSSLFPGFLFSSWPLHPKLSSIFVPGGCWCKLSSVYQAVMRPGSPLSCQRKLRRGFGMKTRYHILHETWTEGIFQMLQLALSTPAILSVNLLISGPASSSRFWLCATRFLLNKNWVHSFVGAEKKLRMTLDQKKTSTNRDSQSQPS